jgi:DNA (cytosine-5)-methyltransferase 1
MENVPDMALGDDMRSVRFMADRLEAIGYDTDMRILEAWRFGVPQHRQRLLFVGLRDGFVTWPAERDQVTLRDAIGDLPRLRGTTGKPVARYAGPKNDFQRAARQDVANEDEDLIHDHVTRPVRPDDLEAFKLMTPQTRYSDLPDQLKRYREDIFNDKYHRLDWDSWCRSITAHIAKDGYSYIHPSEHRTLTVREAARIQTFPDSFRFSGSRSDAFRLIGNAVPPRLGHVVASEVLAAQVRGPAETGHGLSEGREKVRKRLIGWASDSTAPAWRRVGQPWDVLIGTLAGRRSPELADHILNSLPKITSATPSRISKLVDRATSEREAEILWTLLEVARAVKRSGWESGDWTCAPGLGDADVRWVETLGLGVKHVVATTGTLRIAGRLTGHPESSGVARRILLGQVVGYGDSSALITSALAGLAEENCGPSRPRCAVCPIADLCESADMAVSK